jgi:hypothetical protein
MKKRDFLAPLAVSIAALLGSSVASAAPTPRPGTTITVKAPGADQRVPPAFVLERPIPGKIVTAGHSSHSSHVSHSSHYSHRSGY